MGSFFRRGVSSVIFAPAVSNLAAPTRAEITAGVVLDEAVAEIAGFALSNSPISVPSLAHAFTSTIPGEDTVADSSLTVNDDDTDTDIREALAKGTDGFLILMPYGDVPTKRCESWPVTVTGFNDQWSMGNDPAQAISGFAVTGVPEQNAVIPALT